VTRPNNNNNYYDTGTSKGTNVNVEAISMQRFKKTILVRCCGIDDIIFVQQ